MKRENENRKNNLFLFFFLFPTRVLGPGSEGRRAGEEGRDGTTEDEVSDDSNLYVKWREGEVSE